MFEELRANLFKEGPDFSAFEVLNTCILYDLPVLRDVAFSKEDERYVVEGTTDNLQTWRVSFSGVSQEGHLIDKEILAARGATVP
jgi:hypothetical protein